MGNKLYAAVFVLGLAAGAVRAEEKAAAAPAETPAPAAAPAPAPEETGPLTGRSKITIDPGIYGFLPGLYGHVYLGPVDIDMAAPSDSLIKLNGFFMATLRLGYDKFGFNFDLFYGSIKASNERPTVDTDIDETVIQTSLSYYALPWLEPYAGFRYDRVGVNINRPPSENFHPGLRDWYDPIVGIHMTGKASESWTLHLRADVGGFGVGSEVTWQLIFTGSWRATKWLSLDLSYRILYLRYVENNQGDLNYLKFDMTEAGPQVGVTFPIDL